MRRESGWSVPLEWNTRVGTGTVGRVVHGTVPDRLAMVAEEIDAGCTGLEWDRGAPGVVPGVERHVFPLITRKQLVDIRRAPVGAAVEHPPDTTTFGNGTGLEGHRDQQSPPVHAGGYGWRFQRCSDTLEEMPKQER